MNESLFFVEGAALGALGDATFDLIEVGVVTVFADDQLLFEDDDFLFAGEKVVVAPDSEECT